VHRPPASALSDVGLSPSPTTRPVNPLRPAPTPQGRRELHGRDHRHRLCVQPMTYQPSMDSDSGGRRTREDNRGRLCNPARLAQPRPPALRTSHFPGANRDFTTPRPAARQTQRSPGESAGYGGVPTGLPPLAGQPSSAGRRRRMPYKDMNICMFTTSQRPVDQRSATRSARRHVRALMPP